ncbi:YtzH-like family protein [Alkalihalobacterium chitinilyticum]|uniref:YtzH-like family protein n=1 Tax=Alkalihalobacterium chitinilyticum TaxID=2980103 RepID=A0ABT5VMZ7_9BACI|nr:YtzH-like family protein [Alkalihalobacterium chitinilyticum]MDE5415858.1 YtzH-like family protein [Alkalihalobacterium chitinilyticum]
MPMNSYDKLGLLTDILKNQSSEQYMTKDEYEQINRLTQSLIADSHNDPNLLQALQSIQQLNVDNHQPFVDQDVNQWIEILDNTSLT